MHRASHPARTARVLFIIVSKIFSDFSGCQGRGGLRGKHTTPVAIVHHRDSHRNLAWRPIPQPRQTGSPEGGCYRAGEVLRKSTRGNYGKRVSHTTQKIAHRASHRVPYPPLWGRL